jgi:hypothetical protein
VLVWDIRSPSCPAFSVGCAKNRGMLTSLSLLTAVVSDVTEPALTGLCALYVGAEDGNMELFDLRMPSRFVIV